MCVTSLSLVIHAYDKDLSPIINGDITMSQGGEDLFNKEGATFSNGVLRIQLAYDNQSDLSVEDGDILDIQLKAEESAKDFLQIDYTFSRNSSLVDSHTKEKVASLDMSNRSGVKMTFLDMKASFDATLNIPFEVDTQTVNRYFSNHQDEAETEYRYKLMIDGKDTDKELVCIMKKPVTQEPDTIFNKTSGTYNQVGDFGQGYMLYNIKMATKLDQNNEFIIYDTPDVNLSFDGYLSICNGQRYGDINDSFFRLSDDGNHWVEDDSSLDDEKKMELWVYDIYYLTSTDDVNKPQQATYKEEKISFDRVDGYGNTPIESKDTVTMPDHILLTKPSGEKLTEEEQALIDANGGLYKEVGKGFKIRIKNFKGNGINPGGFLTFIYRLNIKGNSPMLNRDGLSVYLNTASYYAQEIPDCTPDDTYCEPIEHEKTTLQQIVEGDKTTEADVDKGEIGAEIDQYSTVDFTKVDNQTQKPLAGAIFSIYTMENGQKVIAQNKNGVTLDHLITDEDGKLTKGGEPIALNLKRGAYVFEEIAAPDGYEIIEKETTVTVGLLDNEVVISNSLKDVEPDPEITIKAEDMTIYTGGTSMDQDSFPTVRYSAELPEGSDIKELTFTYRDENFQMKESSFTDIYELDEIFTYLGEEDVALHDGKAGYYQINVKDNDQISAVDQDGNHYVVHFEPGQLLVRYVSDPQQVLEDNDTISLPVTTTIPQQKMDRPFGVVDENTIYKTNGKEELKLYGDNQNQIIISLLADDLLDDGKGNRYQQLQDRSEEYFTKKNVSIENRQYVMKYLDLINETDGNAWVSSRLGVDVYWPYPEGTDQNTEFKVLHFQNLHREYGFGSNAELEEAIQASEIEEMTIENTEYGILFHVPESGFSPFVVSWTTDDNDQTIVDPDDQPTTPDEQPVNPEDKPSNPADNESQQPNQTVDKDVVEDTSSNDFHQAGNLSKDTDVIKTDDTTLSLVWLSLSAVSLMGVIYLRKRCD